jgi:chemotaxis protein MotA
MIILGLLISLVSITFGFLEEGGKLSTLLAPSAALIVFGGTIGATVMSYSKEDIFSALSMLKMVIFKSVVDKSGTIEKIVALAEKARREGILYLENDLDEIEIPFLRKGIQLIVDGTNPEMLRTIMETEMYTMQEKQEIGASVFEKAGGYAPTMGIIGTVMGLVHVLGNLSDPEKLGPSIAMAFIATLYGIGSANIIYLPIAGKISNVSKQDAVLKELMLEGLMSIQAGNNPVLIREKLTAFLNPKEREGEMREAVVFEE